MKFELKKSHIAAAVAFALSGAAFTTAHAAPALITDGAGTFATIADAGYFQPGGGASGGVSPSGIGLRYSGIEFVDWDTQASNYTLTVGGVAIGGGPAYGQAGFPFPAGPTNPLGALTSGALFDGSVTVSSNIGGGGTGWRFSELVEITSPGHVNVTVTLTNLTGATATNVLWGVGFDPDQGRNFAFDNSTHNVINATGLGSSVTASYDGVSITLADTTKGFPTAVTPYIDSSSCCAPVDPGLMFASGQAAGFTTDGDHSINLAYNLGNILAGHHATIGYEYIMAVPEPETYAMLLAGLGLIGFSARRRISA